MGDDGRMDLCECFWGHELAMRRLLNLIRNSQATCTDNECFDDSVFRSPNASDNANSVLMAFVFFVVILYLFIFRPSNNFRASVDARKPNNNDGNGGNRPSALS